MTFFVYHKPEHSDENAWTFIGRDEESSGAMDYFKSPGDLVDRSLLKILDSSQTYPAFTCSAFGVYSNGQSFLVDKMSKYDHHVMAVEADKKSYFETCGFDWDAGWRHCPNAGWMLSLAMQTKTNPRKVGKACLEMVRPYFMFLRRNKKKIKAGFDAFEGWIDHRVSDRDASKACEAATTMEEIDLPSDEISVAVWIFARIINPLRDNPVGNISYHLQRANPDRYRQLDLGNAWPNLIRTYITTFDLVENIKVPVI